MGKLFFEKIKISVAKHINLKSFLGFAISALLLYLTFQNSGLQLKDLNLKGAEWFYFSGAIAVFVFATWLQSFRTKLLWLSGSVKLKDINTYSSLMIGNFYNCLLPGNLGEGVRAFHFSRKNNKTFAESLSGIITEKWTDAQMFVPVSLVLLSMKPFVNHYILYAICYTSLLVVALTIIHTVMRRYRYVEKRVWHFILLFKKTGRFLYRVYYHTNSLLSNLKKNGVLAAYLTLCFAFFFLNITQFYLLLKAAGVQAPVDGIYTAYLTALSIMIIVIVPSAPSNIGVMHYGLYITLILAAKQYGIVPDVLGLKSYALFAIYVHLSYIVPEVTLGVAFVVKERHLIFSNKVMI